MCGDVGYVMTYGAFGTDPPTPFGVGGLNSIALALPAFAGTSSTAVLAMTRAPKLKPNLVRGKHWGVVVPTTAKQKPHVKPFD